MKKIILTLLFFSIAIITSSVSAYAQEYILDPTFDHSQGPNSTPRDFAFQSDEKIIVVGDFTDVNGISQNHLTRLHVDGSVDTSFNIGTGANFGIQEVVVLLDDKIVIAGSFTQFNGISRNRIVRLNADGSLDTSFDPGTGLNNRVSDLILQPDGKLIIAGRFGLFNGVSRNKIVRLNADGSLDTSFDPGTGANNRVWSAALMPDGDIIIAGDFTQYNGVSRNRIARLNADGSLDTSFDPGTGANGRIGSVLVYPDEDILITGNFTEYQGNPFNKIARLNPDGSIDTSFDAGTGLNLNSDAQFLDNRNILLTGTLTQIDGNSSPRIGNILPDGSYNQNFDIGRGFNSGSYAAAIQDNQRIVLGGFFSTFDSQTAIRMARLVQRPEIIITPVTTVNNASIVDTTINVTHPEGILTSEVTVGASSTAATSSFSCVQTTATEVECSISIDSSGSLVIEVNHSTGLTSQSQGGYIVDTVNPSVPTVQVDTSSGIELPILTYSATDNIEVDYYEITYTPDDNNPGTVGSSTIISPANSPTPLVLDPDTRASAPFTHEITVRVFDTAGNITENTVLFPPIIEYNTPTIISNVAITDASFTITSPEDNDISNIVFNPGTTGATLGTCTGDNGDTLSPYESPVTCDINTVTSSGTIFVEGQDSVTTATGNNAQSFIIDVEAPTISITSPTLLANTSITDTNIQIFDNERITASEVTLSLTNQSGGIILDTSECLQITSTQVDCTFSLVNEGTATVQVEVSDDAGNPASSSSSPYTIDMTPPIPVTPDLSPLSDSGISSSDNLTNDTNPVLTLSCSEATSSLDLYTNNPDFDTLITSFECADTAPQDITPDSPFVTGDHELLLIETDNAGNQAQAILDITIDISVSGTTINTPTQGTPVTGVTEALSEVIVTTPSGSSCTTTSDTSGNYSCVLTPTPTHNDDIMVDVTDRAGNQASTTESNGIDQEAPATPIIDPVEPGALVITGTGEEGSTITLDIGICTNAPVVVTGGIWSCDILDINTPQAGTKIIAIATDNVGNTATGSYQILNPTRSGRRLTQSQVQQRFTQATNTTTEEPSQPTESNPFNGIQCPSEQMVTDNMKQGDRNGQYSTYNQATVTQVNLLQQHMNRLLLDEYGTQASGPVDGIFGPLTKQGVERLQNRLNELLPDMTPLTIDGIVGPFTKAAINQSC